MTDQEVVALTLCAAAAAFLFRKLTGWPARRAPRGPQPVVSGRLARALRAAEEKRDASEPEDAPHPSDDAPTDRD